MFLSDEQMNAATFGLKNETAKWSLLELPEGPQPIPEWAKALHVYWADGYTNSPSFTLKCIGNLCRWENKRFSREGSRWMACHPDGRAEIYYQDGELRIERLRRFQTLDGKLHSYRPQTGPRIEERDEAGNITISHVPFDAGEWVELDRLCTRQEDGFGGSHIDLVMEDGTEVTLRGPWHGGAPKGYIELAYADASAPDFARTNAFWQKARRKNDTYRSLHCWGTATGGLYLREDVFVLIFARFLPHLRLAVVDNGRRDHLQPLKPEWSEPKAWVKERERRDAIWRAMKALVIAGTMRPTDEASYWALSELVRSGLAEKGAYSAKISEQEFSLTKEAQASAALVREEIGA